MTDSVFAPFVEQGILAGAVGMVAGRKEILSVDVSGWADIAGKKPMEAGAMFWIASMSKPMTVAAFMMLVDEGKVSIDDPVEKYLPEFRNQMLAVESDADHVLLKKPCHPVTVRNILSHTSGMPFASELENASGSLKIDTLTLHEASINYAMTPLQTQPDSKYRYSNAGINTAGRIIEVVSGMSYEEFMKRRIFEPLGMTDTVSIPYQAQAGRIAKSYRPNVEANRIEEIEVGQLSYPLTNPARQPSPAGGYFSTARDMTRFGMMILNGGLFEGKRLLSEESVRVMTSTHAGDCLNDPNRETGYGLGWSTNAKTGTTVPVAACGHGGAYATLLMVHPEHELVIVYMVQHAGFLPGGEKIYPAYEAAAVKQFSGKALASDLAREGNTVR